MGTGVKIALYGTKTAVPDSITVVDGIKGAVGVGTFTATAAGTTTITDSDVAATSSIFFCPANSAAGLLTATKTCYVGTVSAGSFLFMVSATGSGAPAGTEVFNYLFLKES